MKFKWRATQLLALVCLHASVSIAQVEMVFVGRHDLRAESCYLNVLSTYFEDGLRTRANYRVRAIPVFQSHLASDVFTLKFSPQGDLEARNSSSIELLRVSLSSSRDNIEGATEFRLLQLGGSTGQELTCSGLTRLR